MPQVPGDDFYRASLQARPFQPIGSAPVAPNAILARLESLRDELRAAFAAPPYWVMAGGLVLSLAVGDTVFKKVGHSIGIMTMIVLACLAMGIPLLMPPIRRWSALQRGWSANADEEHAAAIAEWEAGRATTEDDWFNREQDRVVWVKRLIDGDVDAIGETLIDTLSDLDFPFEASCRVGANSPSAAFILLDLPEIEDVVPETKQTVLRSGEIKESRRTKLERATAYAELVAGLGLWCSRAAFSVIPTLANLSIAAYTQRRQPRSGELRDDFVYEFTISRQRAAEFQPAHDDPVRFVKALDSRIDMRENAELKAIAPPPWRSEFEA